MLVMMGALALGAEWTTTESVNPRTNESKIESTLASEDGKSTLLVRCEALKVSIYVTNVGESWYRMEPAIFRFGPMDPFNQATKIGTEQSRVQKGGIRRTWRGLLRHSRLRMEFRPKKANLTADHLVVRVFDSPADNAGFVKTVLACKPGWESDIAAFSRWEAPEKAVVSQRAINIPVTSSSIGKPTKPPEPTLDIEAGLETLTKVPPELLSERKDWRRLHLERVKRAMPGMSIEDALADLRGLGIAYDDADTIEVLGKKWWVSE